MLAYLRFNNRDYEGHRIMNRLIIIGASGHGKVVADIAEKSGYSDIVFLDNNPKLITCAGYPVIGPDMMASELEGDLFIAIGNASIRERLMNREKGRQFPILIHPNAVIGKGVEIGEGSVIMAGAVINPGVNLGRGVIVNTCSSIDHDCEIDDYVHVSVGAHLCGTVKARKRAWIGAGAVIINNIDICSDCILGAGAVVTKNIEEAGVYIGVPAKRYR